MPFRASVRKVINFALQLSFIICEGYCVSIDRFTEQFAQVRSRFATKLDGRLQEIDALVPALSDSGADVTEAVKHAHRRIHDLCGLSATVGYPAVGFAERGVEKVLRGPLKSARGLTGDELVTLQDKLDHLRAAARTEISVPGEGAV